MALPEAYSGWFGMRTRDSEADSFMCSRDKIIMYWGGLVVDFFLGSGSTMVAAHQVGRKCYGIEMDPAYCQTIVDRMKRLDPGIEIIINP